MPQERSFRIGTVDLNRVFGSLHRFTELKRQMEEARSAVDEEMKKREEQLRNASPQDKYAETTEFQKWRKSQAVKMHKLAEAGRAKIVADIKQAVQQRAEKIGIDLVIDTGEVNSVGTPVVLFARPEFDMTDKIIGALNRASS